MKLTALRARGAETNEFDGIPLDLKEIYQITSTIGYATA